MDSADAVEKFVNEYVPQINSLLEGTMEKEHGLEGIRLLRDASNRLKNCNHDRARIYPDIVRGLTLVIISIYDKQKKRCYKV
jgi:hypothetical protein